MIRFLNDDVMKRKYSVILLVSFLIGAAQPILPMIEYQLYEGNVFELFSKGSIDTDSSCNLNVRRQDNCENQQSGEDQNLLDIDYYPLALQITPVSEPVAFPLKTPFQLFTISRINSPPILPIPPPPRFAELKFFEL